MTANIYPKISSNTSSSAEIRRWYIDDVLRKQNGTLLRDIKSCIESIKRDGDSSVVNIPVLSNNTFKGIFRKHANSETYASFDLKVFNGPKMLKEYSYKNKPIQIPQLRKIYDEIDELWSILGTECQDCEAFAATIARVGSALDSIIAVFGNQSTETVDIVLDGNLTLQIYLKRDSMVIKFRLKNSLDSIAYINDPFVINLYSKVHHLKDQVDLVAWNLKQLSGEELCGST